MAASRLALKGNRVYYIIVGIMGAPRPYDAIQASPHQYTRRLS